MARPIKRLHGEPDVVKELRRRSRSTTIGVRDRERAEIILLRLDGVGVEAVAERLKTTPKRVSPQVIPAGNAPRITLVSCSNGRHHGLDAKDVEGPS